MTRTGKANSLRSPPTVRHQLAFLESLVVILRPLSESAQKSSARRQPRSSLPVPVRTDLPPHKYPALIELAKQVASVHPLRPDWLLAENWPNSAGSQAALAKLDEAAGIVKRLEGRLDSDQILRYHQTAATRPLLDSRLSAVQLLLADAQIDEVAVFQKQLDEAVTLLREIQTQVSAVLVEGMGNRRRSDRFPVSNT